MDFYFVHEPTFSEATGVKKRSLINAFFAHALCRRCADARLHTNEGWKCRFYYHEYAESNSFYPNQGQYVDRLCMYFVTCEFSLSTMGFHLNINTEYIEYIHICSRRFS